MKRREFLKFGAAGLTVVAVGSIAEWPMFWSGSQAHASSLSLDRLKLEMLAVQAEMVNGVQVPMWAFRVDGDDHDGEGQGITVPRIPGPAMIALEGDRIRLRIENNIGGTRVHRFAIPGVTLRVDGDDVSSVAIPHGDQVDIEFTAPAPGTYMYLDPENAPVNRMMGLHGVLVVLPNPVENTTPYSNPSANISALFDDLGTADHFPGNPWDPTRNAIWLFNVIDSVRCAEAAGSAAAISASRFSMTTGFLPDYFTLNGKSGFFSAQHHHHSEGMEMVGHDSENQLIIAENIFDLQSNISIRGHVGQPLVIRSLNAGNMWHSPHIHGNHIYPLSHANALDGRRIILNNLTMLDTWSLAPGDVKDLLLPFIQPPDIPASAWPPVDEKFPLVYPMHDHNEISNTAAGGNYPQGIATHWQIDGPFDPTDPGLGIIVVTRAELRVKTGQLLIEGRFTVPSPNGTPYYLDVHSGGPAGEVISDRIQVGTAAQDGRFSYRGRALKAVDRRFITIMFHSDHAEHEGGESHTSTGNPTITVPLVLR